MVKLLLTFMIFCGLAASLSGCATPSLRDRVNTHWKGSTKEDVVDHFGLPENVYKDSSGRESFSYKKHGPMASVRYVFKFNEAGRVRDVRIHKFVEDDVQFERKMRMEAEYQDQIFKSLNKLNRITDPPQ